MLLNFLESTAETGPAGSTRYVVQCKKHFTPYFNSTAISDGHVLRRLIKHKKYSKACWVKERKMYPRTSAQDHICATYDHPKQTQIHLLYCEGVYRGKFEFWRARISRYLFSCVKLYCGGTVYPENTEF